jgi:hypothetical protein
MPIRINLLAEQQAAEEARRKDPVKRALWIGSALIFLTVVWTLLGVMETKARRAEVLNLTADFTKVDESARQFRNKQAEAGDIERRISSLERYSTNRVLWGSTLDAFQKLTVENIKFQNLSSSQQYTTRDTTNFFTTNLNVPFTPPPAAWKFWASASAQPSPQLLASNLFKSFTNAPPFSTNKLPYTVKMTITATNLVQNFLIVRADFALPAVTIEDIEITIRAGDYGASSASIDDFARRILAFPYFAERLGTRDSRLHFLERPLNREADSADPKGPTFLPFAIRLTFEDRVLTNE